LKYIHVFKKLKSVGDGQECGFLLQHPQFKGGVSTFPLQGYQSCLYDYIPNAEQDYADPNSEHMPMLNLDGKSKEWEHGSAKPTG